MVIPYARQSVDETDVEAVIRALRSDWLTQGPEVSRFERAIAEYCGGHDAVAVSSGTAALHVAALAADLKPGKRLWTSPNSFVASANCGLYCGASIDFVDIDGDDGNISVPALKQKLDIAERAGLLPDVVVPVHFGGQSCDMEGLAALRERYGFKIIEDASHALGGRYNGRPVGECLYSDMTVFSLHPVKIVTAGEGGIVATNSNALAEKLRLFRTHGIVRPDEAEGTDPWLYRQVQLGYNYRLTDLQAALGLSQLRRIDDFVARRHEIAERYDVSFANTPVRPLARRDYAHSAYHLYVVRLPPAQRRAIFDGLARVNIRAQVHYIPIHTQPYFQAMGFKTGDFPVSEAYYASAISLPMFPGLTEADQRHVIDEVLRLAR